MLVTDAELEVIDCAGVLCKRQWLGSWIGRCGQYTYSVSRVNGAWEVGLLDREDLIAIARGATLYECERAIERSLFACEQKYRRAYVSFARGTRPDLEIEQEWDRTIGYSEPPPPPVTDHE